MKIGDIKYIIESNAVATQVKITAIQGEFCTCKLPSGGAIRLRKSRLYASKEEAEADIPGFRRDKEEKKERPPRSPYEYLWNDK